MNEAKAKKKIDKAEARLKNAQRKLKRAEDKQEKEAAKAEAKDKELAPARAKKLDASIEAMEKDVQKAAKELTRAQDKHEKLAAKQNSVSGVSEVNLTGITPEDIPAAVQQALAASTEVTVTGETLPLRAQLQLKLGSGQTLLWKAVSAAECPGAAIALEHTSEEDTGERTAPTFCLAEEGQITNTAQGGSLLEARGVTIRVDGGSAHSLHGNGVRTDGMIEMLAGVIAAEGTDDASGEAVHCGEAKLQGGFVFGRSRNGGEADESLSGSGVIGPISEDTLEEGTCCVCIWHSGDGTLPRDDGSEAGLAYWPEDACVWWDVAPDGTTSIYAGRGDQSENVVLGTQTLPEPPRMEKAGTEVVAMPIVFDAKTEDGERPVLLNISWGWNLFLSREGASEYDNRLAVAGCALSNSVYHEEEIEKLLTRLGFADPVLKNYGNMNDTSAFALAHAEIEDAGTKKTIFAVVNRGSKTLMDWKGNILDETIQNDRFFQECADTVASAIPEYVKQYGQKEPDRNLFFVTGHSLGAVVTDLLAAQHFEAYPANNVFAYTFAAPLADPEAKVDNSRSIYNILNQNDAVTSFPPRPGYKRVGGNNYTFSTTGDNARAMARPFRFLSHMDIGALEKMSKFTGFFKKAVPSILWNHSLTTYMAYLLAGGPESVKGSKGIWSIVQTVIGAVGGKS